MPEAKEVTKKSEVLAVVLIRGNVNIKAPIKEALKMLHLKKKNSCIIMEKTPTNIGMVKKVKDYVTYGEIDPETLKILATKRKKQPHSSKSYKVFTLNPPKGGFERKGIKKSFTSGGALGYRGAKINIILKKMI